MSKRFITFKPVRGIYEKAIRPYKRWYELADMSPWIEVDEEYYRILLITGLIKKNIIKKMVICSENGELVRDEALSRKCSKIIHYLHSFEHNSKVMILSSKDDTPTKLGEFIVEFKQMRENVAPKLSREQLKAMDLQLYYYTETKRYMEIVAEVAKKLCTYIQPLEEDHFETFSAYFIKELGEHLQKWEENKRYTQALLIENDRKAKGTVRKILRNPDYQSCFPNQEIKKEMLSEMLQSELALTRLIDDGKKGWERERKHLNPRKGKFNIETYIDELWKRNNSEVFLEVNTNDFITDFWLFSSTKN